MYIAIIIKLHLSIVYNVVVSTKYGLTGVKMLNKYTGSFFCIVKNCTKTVLE